MPAGDFLALRASGLRQRRIENPSSAYFPSSRFACTESTIQSAALVAAKCRRAAAILPPAGSSPSLRL